MTAPATDTDEVSCPKCGGRMWDNREGKKNPKAPDFKCRDRSCDGVIWPPKGTKPFPKPAVVKQGYSTPKALPGEFDGYEEEQTAELNAHTGRATPQPATAESRGTAVAHQYESTCDWVLKHIVPKLASADIPVDAAAINSMVATILISAQRAGV